MPFKSKKQQRKCYAMQASGKGKGWNCEEWSKETNFKKLPEETKKATWDVSNYLKYAATKLPELSDGYEKVAHNLFDGVNLPSSIKQAFPQLDDSQVVKLAKLFIGKTAEAKRLAKRATCAIAPSGVKVVKIRKKVKPIAKVTVVKKTAMEKQAWLGAIMKGLKGAPMAVRGLTKATTAAPKILTTVDKGKRLNAFRTAFGTGMRGGNVGRITKGGVGVQGGARGLGTAAEAYDKMRFLPKLGYGAAATVPAAYGYGLFTGGPPQLPGGPSMPNMMLGGMPEMPNMMVGGMAGIPPMMGGYGGYPAYGRGGYAGGRSPQRMRNRIKKLRRKNRDLRKQLKPQAAPIQPAASAPKPAAPVPQPKPPATVVNTRRGGDVFGGLDSVRNLS
jgi:hypothetical protein